VPHGDESGLLLFSLSVGGRRLSVDRRAELRQRGVHVDELVEPRPGKIVLPAVPPSRRSFGRTNILSLRQRAEADEPISNPKAGGL